MHDIERITIDGGYRVECGMCGEWFDAVRYDAAYCSSTCRSRYHRSKKILDKRIEHAEKSVNELINHLPKNGESKTYITLLALSRRIASALTQVEMDD